MNAVTEDKGDRDDGPVPESLVAHKRESHAARITGLKERLRLPLMVGVPLVVGAVGIYFYLTGARYESTDDAYLRAAQVSISPNVSGDRKSTRLNSSHRCISYAVFCLKKILA